MSTRHKAGEHAWRPERRQREWRRDGETHGVTTRACSKDIASSYNHQTDAVAGSKRTVAAIPAASRAGNRDSTIRCSPPLSRGFPPGSASNILRCKETIHHE